MQSEIARRLKLRYAPVAILFSNEKPEGALEFKEGRWGCVVAMLTATAKGRKAVFSRTTTGCPGGKIGLALSDRYAPGMEYFLSTGNEMLPEGEAYKKTPELAKDFIDSSPTTEIAEEYVIFAPLAEIDPAKEKPRIVVFYANPDQLSALVVLANYSRTGRNNVIAPFGAGCHSVCLIPWDESSKEQPHAVIGMTDVSARPFIDADLLSFSVPYGMFQEMEDDVPNSFLDRESWAKVAKRIQ